MDFDFNEDQRLIAETVRKFLDGRYPLEQHIQKFEDSGSDNGLWTELGELGVPSMLIEEAAGGQGMSFIDAALVFEELGRALVPVSIVESIVAGELLSKHGSKNQKSQWLSDLGSGSTKVAIAISEAGGDYGLSGITARASRNGAGWNLKASKIMTPDIAGVDLLLIVSQIDTGTDPVVLLLDRARWEKHTRSHETIDRATGVGVIDLDGIKVDVEDFLGGETMSAEAAKELFDACTAAYALYQVGLSGKMLDAAVDYAAQRVQFGKAIGSFQAIKHKCADMAVLLESARSAAYYASWATATNSEDRAKAVSMAKAYCGDASATICNDSIQVHGGMGFTWELGLHYYLRRAKYLEYAFGDARFHRERVVAFSLNELGVGN